MQKHLKRIDQAKSLFSQYSYLFACPHCGARMEITPATALQCQNNHAFDLAKQGYLNLFSGNPKTGRYDQELFASRLALHQRGLFDRLLTMLERQINSFAPLQSQKPLVILDAGCGEGSHLASIVGKLESAGTSVLGIGLDLAKTGIRLAASRQTKLLWCVADLAHSPLKPAQCGVILNILSPANYAEFQRLLLPSGVVIKVLPGPDYLAELRTALYAGSSKENYRNADTLQHFSQQFELLDKQELIYQQRLTDNDLEHLLRMTPLAWNASSTALLALRKTPLELLTIDLTILVGRRKND